MTTTQSRPTLKDFDEASALLDALLALKRGDFTARLPSNWTGVAGKIADAFNDVIDTNHRMAEEVKRVSHAVGKQGKTRQRLRADRPRWPRGAIARRSSGRC
jgi:methyl-accepting chemotaxis protein